jgi:hypothetical protein
MRCFGRTGFFGEAVRAFALTALRAEDRAAALVPLRFFTAVLLAGLDAFCLAIVCLPDLSRARRMGATGRQISQSWTRQQLQGLDQQRDIGIVRSLSEAVVANGRRLVFVPSPI